MSFLADAIGDVFPQKNEETQEVSNENNEQVVENENLERDTTATEDNKPTPAVEEEGGLDFVSEETSDEIEVETTEQTTDELASEFVLDEQSTQDFDISSYTDGEFSKVEDLVNEYKALKENTLSSENIFEQLNAQSEEKYGLSFSEVMAWKNTDYNSMDEWAVLSEYEEMKDPDVTDLEIKAELEEFSLLKKSQEEINEMIEDGDLTQREYDSLQAKFTRRVRNARHELSEFRDNLGFDDFQVNGYQQQEKQYQPTEEEIAAQVKQMEQELNSLTKLRMNVGGKDSPSNLDFNVTQDERANMLNTLSDQNWLVNRWANEDGSINKNKAYRDTYILMNFNKMIKAAYSEGMAKGSKETVVNEDNITLGKGKAQASGGGTVDHLQKIADQLDNYF